MSLPKLLFKILYVILMGSPWEPLECPLTPAFEGGWGSCMGWGAVSLPKDAFIVRQMASVGTCGFLSSGAFSSPGCLCK